MKTFGMLLLAAALLTLVFAWTFQFPGMTETVQRWDAQNNRWGAAIVTRDEKKPLRWTFTGVAAVALAAGAVLVGLPRRTLSP